MPNCFALSRKGAPQGAPRLPLNTVVDVEIANHLGIPVDPRLWCCDWYHVIGFLIACKQGCDLGTSELRLQVQKWYDDIDSIYRLSVNNGKMTEDERLSCRDRMLRILDFMEEQYTSDNWVQIGRRDSEGARV